MEKCPSFVAVRRAEPSTEFRPQRLRQLLDKKPANRSPCLSPFWTWRFVGQEQNETVESWVLPLEGLYHGAETLWVYQAGPCDSWKILFYQREQHEVTARVFPLDKAQYVAEKSCLQ
jgi:hypothetical protein